MHLDLDGVSYPLHSRKVAFEPFNVRLALECKDMGTDTVKEERSCEMTTAQPQNPSRQSSSARNVSTSKSLVGSSNNKTLPPDFSRRAICTRLRSPPDSRFTVFC